MYEAFSRGILNNTESSFLFIRLVLSNLNWDLFKLLLPFKLSYVSLHCSPIQSSLASFDGSPDFFVDVSVILGSSRTAHTFLQFSSSVANVK